MIDVLDYLTYRIYGSDDDYLYGIRSGGIDTQLFRLTSRADRPTTPIYTFPGSVRGVWTSPTNPGLVFVQDSPGNGKRRLYKSIDYGVNFGANSPLFNDGQPVLRIGDIDGTEANQIDNVSILGRGLCIVGNTVYVAEYNVNGSRVSGATNDRVCLRRSTNAGTTWSVVAEWNSDGSHHVRHMHSVQFHAGYVYMTFGDNNAESGILRWDGVSVLPSNQPLSAYLECYTGAQRYRSGDILFPPGDYMYWMSDTDIGDSERGVWRSRKDMTDTPVRMSAHITAVQNHSGWYGAILPSGRMIFTSFVEQPAVDRNMRWFGSDDGNDWSVVGTYQLKGGSGGGADEMFVRNGELYYAKAGGAGKSSVNDTTVLIPDDIIDPQRVLHPVYWVSRRGRDTSDDYRGYSPDRPWRRLGYALTGDRVTHGARVIVTEGNYTESTITPAWGGNSNPSPTQAPVKIEGRPDGAAVIYLQDVTSPLIAEDATQPAAVIGVQYMVGKPPSIRDSRSGPAILIGNI